ncbi:MAG TPA: hypothetical protein VLA20_01585, partial [Vicinamibacterales bacterium]|nr:hypothetical protein [Vicinamibacterales bacterium]
MAALGASAEPPLEALAPFARAARPVVHRVGLNAALSHSNPTLEPLRSLRSAFALPPSRRSESAPTRPLDRNPSVQHLTHLTHRAHPTHLVAPVEPCRSR